MNNVPQPPPPQYQQQQQIPQIINNNNKRQLEQDPSRRTRSRQDAKASHATTIPKYWTDIVNKYNTAQIRIPRTNDVRTKLNFESKPPFAQALGINANDCINYCIKGECWLNNCKRDHPATISPNANVLTPAYTALFNDLKSKK